MRPRFVQPDHQTEIDHNFSKAHRIVTTSILPVVEQYGEHSRAVWEATKFWKQFFEASANVSLSGYEELASDDDGTTVEETTVHDEVTTDYTPRQGDDVTTSTAGGPAGFHGEDSLLDDGDLTGSTPRPPATTTIKPNFADLESPYENLKRRMKGDGGAGAGDDEDDTSILLQQHTQRLPDMSMTPRSSLTPEPDPTAQRAKDPLLHRVLDKNYRIQATPLRPGLRISPLKKETKDTDAPAWQDSPMSSPEMAIPTLRSQAFMSPVRTAARQRLAAAVAAGPRTPGVSVQTPAAGRKTRDALQQKEDDATEQGAPAQRQKYEIDWDSDSDEDSGKLYGGMSPPKTIQFALPPSKLLQTPGRLSSVICRAFFRPLG